MADHPSTTETVPRLEEQTEIVPIVEERLRVDKVERDQSRVVIRIKVSERTEYAELDLQGKAVVVERTPINRVVDAAPSVRREGDTLVVPVIEEIMVVEKRLLLKEEVRVRQEPVTRHVREFVVLRSEEASVDRQAPHSPPSEEKEKL